MDVQYPVHPLTGLTALGFTSRGPVWPVMGGAPEDEDTNTETAVFELPDPLPEDEAELGTLLEAGRAEFERVHAAATADGAAPTDSEIAELERIANGIEVVEAAATEVREGAAARSERAAELASRLEAPAEGEGEDNAEGQEGAEGEGADADAEQRETVAASARRARTGFAGAGRGRRSADQVPANQNRARRGGFVIGSKPDARVGTGTFAAAVDKSIGLNATVGVYERDFPRELQADSTDSLVAAIDHATNQTKLDNGNGGRGSLLAAGGWCSPSEVMYDFLDVPPPANLFDLPEVTMSRGGIRFPVEPDFASIYAATGFFQTEAQAIAGDAKPCFEVPCAGFTEVRMDAIGVCITAGLLQNRGFPEIVKRFIDGAMLAHQHRVSKRSIDAVIAGSDPVVVPANQTLGMSGALLSVVSMAIVDAGTKHRMNGQVFEVAMPLWAREQIRADLAYQEEWESKNVTDAQIDQWFAARHARVQWIVDWQSGAAGQPGAVVPITAWPTEVQFVVYPAGTWFRSMMPVIELGTVYDQASLKLNKAVQLFTEDGLAIGKRGIESRVYTLTVETNGAIGPRHELSTVVA